MSFTNDPNIWVIHGLVFVLGLLIGMFLTAGGRRKWRERYNSELDRRRELEKAHAEREKELAAQARDTDRLRAAAIRDRDDRTV